MPERSGSTGSLVLTAVLTLALLGLLGAAGSAAPAASAAALARVSPRLTWVNSLDPSGKGALESVSCVSASFCVAVDADGNEVTWDGTDFVAGVRIATARGAATDALSCPTTSYCLAGNSVGGTETFNGSSWSRGKVPFATGVGVTAVGCASRRLCVATDATGGLRGWNGSKWTSGGSLQQAGTSRVQSAVSCAGGKLCVAYDSSGFAASFDGSSFTPVAEPFASGAELEGVGCISATLCLAVATGGMATFNGSGWSVPDSGPSTELDFGELFCQKASSCEAFSSGAGGSGTFQSFDGSWSAGMAVEDVSGITGVSCTSSASCLLVDGRDFGAEVDPSLEAAAVVDSQELDGLDGQLAALSCRAAGFCAAVTTAGEAWTAVGSSWSGPAALPGPEGTSWAAVSCAASGYCLAVGGGAAASEIDGSSWQPLSGVPAHLTGISCVATKRCIAVNGAGGGYVYNGVSWALHRITADESAVSCSSKDFCMAVGGERAEIFNGSTWTESGSDLPAGDKSVSCTAATFCMVVEEEGSPSKSTYETYADRTWSSAERIVTVSGATAPVSCSSPSLCVVGNVVWNAVAWSEPASWPSEATPACSTSGGGTCVEESDGAVGVLPAVDPPAAMSAVLAPQFTGLSCSAASHCVAVDEEGQAYSLASATSSWVYDGNVDPGHELVGVSCARRARLWCLAIDAAGRVVVDDGGKWASPRAIADGPLTRVSCAGNMFCVVVDAENESYELRGSSVRALGSELPYATDGGSYGLSCTSSRFCMATDSAGTFAVFNGSFWEVGTQKLEPTVACASSRLCVAAAPGGGYLLWNGSSWGRATSFPAHTTAVTSLACASDKLCLAGDSDGEVDRFDGSRWSGPVRVASKGTAVRALSCPTTRACALYSSGNVVYLGSS